MRLLFLVHQFMPEFASGTEHVALTLAAAARRSGHRATVLTCSLDPDAGWRGTTPEGFRTGVVEGIPVVGIPDEMLPDAHGFGRPPDRAAFDIGPALDSFLARERFDVVHVMHTMRVLAVAERLAERGLPMVMTVTDFFFFCHRVNRIRRDDGSLCPGSDHGRACQIHCHEHGIDRRRARMAALLAQAVFVVAGSDFVAEAFRAEYPDLTVRVIPHGIDLLRVRPHVPREGSAVFGYVGTLSETKGADMLVAAFAAARAPHAQLDLYGPLATEHGGLDTLDRYAADPRIRLHGPVPAEQVPQVMADLDVLCLPSRVPETFSLVLHEGFAAGLPALVSDIGHPARIVAEAQCGRAVPAGDTAAWTAAIEQVAADPALRQTWRQRVPLPWREEEEAFLYSQLYRACAG